MFGLLKKLFGPAVDYKQLIADGSIVVDVRTPSEFKQGHRKGAINIPLDSVGSKVKDIQSKAQGKPVIVCCASGMRSGAAAGILRKAGLEAHNAGPWTNVPG